MCIRDRKSCRHTTRGVSLDTGHDLVISCRHVPAGDAADEPGRVGGVLPAARAQRTAPGYGDPGGEGDPQLRPGRHRGPGRSGPCLLYTSDAADDLTRVDL